MSKFILRTVFLALSLSLIPSTEVCLSKDPPQDPIDLQYIVSRTASTISLVGSFALEIDGLKKFDEVRFTHFHLAGTGEPAYYARTLPTTEKSSFYNTDKNDKPLRGVPMLTFRRPGRASPAVDSLHAFELHWAPGDPQAGKQGWLTEHNARYLESLEEAARLSTSIRLFATDLQKKLLNPRQRLCILISTSNYEEELLPLIDQWLLAASEVDKKAQVSIDAINTRFAEKRSAITAGTVSDLQRIAKSRELNVAHRQAVLESRYRFSDIYAKAVTDWPVGTEPAALRELAMALQDANDSITRPDDAIAAIENVLARIKALMTQNQVLNQSGDGERYAAVLKRIGMKGLQREANQLLETIHQLISDLEKHGQQSAMVRAMFPEGTIIDLGQMEFYADGSELPGEVVPLRFRVYVP